MGRFAAVLTDKVMDRLRGAGGLNSVLTALETSAQPVPEEQFLAWPLKPEVIEKHLSTPYPLVLVYCTRLQNRQAEKFRGFSGNAEITVELRVSAERIDSLNEQLQLLVDSVAEVLQSARGDWGDGVFYGGGFDAAFGQIRPGARGFSQDAKVELVVGLSAG